ncbi:hypothetical protein BCR42DRAFT_427566 [Absidia repens]|uniref:Uncharacterized protein n=1 Tax=Absidia repens TaxID=90262 RepID=A0A1X2I0X7_9FUNG|nr:hypothetical protein BCR42DRAFT_427566 [Absidia repens]
MLQRLDTPAFSLPTVGINTMSIYAINLVSYDEYKGAVKRRQYPNKRILRRHPSQRSDVETTSSFSSSITLDDDSWSDYACFSKSSSDSHSFATSTSTLDVINLKKSAPNTCNNEYNRRNHAKRIFLSGFENYHADRRNENDAKTEIDIDLVTQGQDGLTDDEITLYGDEMDGINNDDYISHTPLTSCEFTKKKEIPLVKQRSLLTSMLLHSPPASASSSTLSISNVPSSFINSCSSIITTDTNDVLSSSMKQYVHWEKIQNSGPVAKLVGVQKNSSQVSSTWHINNSFDTSTSCW